MKRGLAGMIYLSYICTRNSAKGELSSAGSERLPYKQRVGGFESLSSHKIENRMKATQFFEWLFYCWFYEKVFFEKRICGGMNVMALVLRRM